MHTYNHIVIQANDMLSLLSEAELSACLSGLDPRTDDKSAVGELRLDGDVTEALTTDEAVLVLSKYIVKTSLDKGVDPLKLTTRIVNEVAYSEQLEHYPEELRVFSGLLSQYEDFSDPVQIDYYGKEKCEKTKADTIRQMMEKLLEFIE